MHGCRLVSYPCGSVMHVRDLHEANTSLTTLKMGPNQIGDEGAAALAEAVRATLVFCTQCFSGHDDSIIARACRSCGYGDFFSVPLEMDVLRQVWRAALCGSRGVHMCGSHGSFI